MSDATTAPNDPEQLETPPQPTVGGPESATPNPATPDADETPQDHTDERKLRKRAQTAEAERDTATARVEALQQREVERLVADRLATPGDLFTYGEGLTLDDLADDTGLIDVARVAEAVDALLDKRPGLAVAQLKKPIPGSYQDSGQFRRPRPATAESTTWEKVKLA